MDNFEEELRAARGRWRYPRTRPHTDFGAFEPVPRLLRLVALAAVLVLAGCVLSYALTIPPAHLIILAVAAWLLWPRRQKRS